MNVIRNLARKIRNKLNRLLSFSFHYKGLKKYDLIIFDTIYPHPVSGFRLEEFSCLLENFKNSKILVNPDNYPLLKTPKELHQKHINSCYETHPNLKGKITKNKGFINMNAKLFYCVFINNIYSYLNVLEKFKIPFIFTLYPGGGFRMNDTITDNKLKNVFASHLFRKVIVTQKTTKDYLLKHNFCTENQIEFIFGGVVPQISLVKDISNRKNYKINKNTLDICFCAAKYMPKGIDKGYDVFIEVAILLSKKYDFVKFHVIGGFDKSDIDVSNIEDKITFYGYQNFENLEAIFKQIDIIISPNKSFILNDGSFDGFPLGTVIEAVFNGAVALVSDDLNQNTIFSEDELIIIESDTNAIVEKLEYLIENPNQIEIIAANGKSKFQHVYSNNYQMNPRMNLLKTYIKS
jgi:glycosyltransferase involved in cell wall biosynthesis